MATLWVASVPQQIRSPSPEPSLWESSWEHRAVLGAALGTEGGACLSPVLSSRLQDFFFLNKFILFFYYFWLGWVFVAAHGLSLVAVSVGCSSLWCAGFSLPWFLLLRSMGSRYVGFNSCSAQAQ